MAKKGDKKEETKKKGLGRHLGTWRTVKEARVSKWKGNGLRLD